MRDYMKLTATQQEIIKVMVDIYEKKGSAVKCEEIAESIHLIHGTIRNQMQIMKSLKLVKGVPGHKGGYIPTGFAYENLKFSQETERIPVYLNGKINSVTLKEIRLKPPNNGVLHVMGDIRDFKTGDRINIASKKLLISGIVVGRDDLNNSLLSSIEIALLFA
jgi:predicted transcriptional regulator